MDFNKILEGIRRQQAENYKQLMSENDVVSRKFFLSVFLNTFLGDYLAPSIPNFEDKCHQIIDSISLCTEEIDFFHKMVDQEFSETYIEDLVKIYGTVENLPECQLGPGILEL